MGVKFFRNSWLFIPVVDSSKRFIGAPLLYGETELS
jgi:hypothetical protein